MARMLRDNASGAADKDLIFGVKYVQLDIETFATLQDKIQAVNHE